MKTLGTLGYHEMGENKTNDKCKQVNLWFSLLSWHTIKLFISEEENDEGGDNYA